jgi:hypothetical protein
MNDRPVSDLEKFFKSNNNKRLIHKYLHYFDIYDRHFGRFRNKEIIILEIGISQGGSYKQMGTFIEYSKRFIDQLNAWHSKQWTLKANSFTKSVDSVHYYDSVLVIEKRNREKPFHEERGTPSFVNTKLAFGPKLKHSIVKRLNAVLALFRLPSL